MPRALGRVAALLGACIGQSEALGLLALRTIAAGFWLAGSSRLEADLTQLTHRTDVSVTRRALYPLDPQIAQVCSAATPLP